MRLVLLLEAVRETISLNKDSTLATKLINFLLLTQLFFVGFNIKPSKRSVRCIFSPKNGMHIAIVDRKKQQHFKAHLKTILVARWFHIISFKQNLLIISTLLDNLSWTESRDATSTKLPSPITTKMMHLHGLCLGQLSHQHSPEVSLLEDFSTSRLSVYVSYWLAASPSFSLSAYHMCNRCYYILDHRQLQSSGETICHTACGWSA